MFRKSLATVAAALLLAAVDAQAAPYQVALYDGGSWNNVYAQGFSTSLGANPSPGLGNGDPVYLSQFKFYKSGNTDGASNLRLAIINNLFANLQGLSTSH